MIEYVEIEELMSLENIIYIDVRSPKEYNEDTIPGAINIPILDDTEREHVGHLYKQVNKLKAKEVGLEYASKKLSNYYRTISEIKDSGKKVVLFCYRGGMRSSSVAKVLDIMGIDILLIKGGYKSYRKYVLESLSYLKDNNSYKFVVLHGHTGVGKTKILEMLSNKNISVIDIEKLARNSGSVFGSIQYNGNSNSQKKFDSLLLFKLKNIKNNLIFIESESRRVGNIMLPDFLYEKMTNGFHILINTHILNRVSNILDEYVYIDIPENKKYLIESILKLKKSLGEGKVNLLISKLKNDEYKFVIKYLMTEYYDPLYQYSIDKVEVYDETISYENINDAIEELINFAMTYSN